MEKLIELFRSSHIQIALITGICIIVMAYVSKRMLAEPIGYLPLTVPPFIATLYESLAVKYKDLKILNTVYGIVAILISTVLVIVFHLLV